MAETAIAWRPIPQTSRLGSAIHDFSARSPNHLSLQLGDCVHILEECGGWYRGTLLKNRLTGIFPASYVHLHSASPLRRGSSDNGVFVDPLDQELGAVLPQWRHLLLYKYYVEKHDMFRKVYDIVLEVLAIWKQLKAQSLSLDEQRKLRHRAAYLVDWGNKTMGLPVLPRNDDKVVIDERSVSLVDLYRMHQQSTQDLAKGDFGARKLSVAVVTSANRRGTDVTEKLHHLYFRLLSFEGHIVGEYELHASLFDVREDAVFSERFIVTYDKNGEPTGYGGADNIRCIFTDLSMFDLQRKEAYLIFHIIRIGDMMDQKASKEVHLYRRPFACAVFPIDGMLQKQLLPQAEAEGFTAELFQCSNEVDFHNMHVSLIKKQTGSYKSLLTRVNFSLQPFHGLLATVREGYPHLFQRSVPICRKLGFPEVMMPGDTRNDIYISLVSGDFKGKDNKTAEKNMECHVSVLLNSGNTLADCISPGASMDHISSYRSLVVRHTNTPQWGETIKLDIPPKLFQESHVRFCCFHRSTNKKGFSHFMLAFLPLVHAKGMALADDEYNLIVYKCDGSLYSSLNPNQYLHLPWNGNEDPPVSSTLPRTMSSSKTLRLKVRTTICSTKLTQNYDLMVFLNWRQCPGMVRNSLQGLMTVSGYEVVKFLQDTLDALFTILREHSQECGQLVFQCLVYIIKLLNETKFENFRSVLDSYIENNFKGETLYRNLIDELRQSLHNAQNSTAVDQRYIRTVQSLQYIFRFIMTSRLRYMRATSEPDDGAFRSSLIGVFDSFVAILEQEKASTNTALQASLLQSFPTIFQEVLQVLAPADFSRVIKRILDCVPSNRLNNQKLHCIGRIVSNELWHHESARAILLPTLASHLKYLMQQGELEAAKCLDIHGDLLRVLRRNDVGAVSGNIAVVAQSFLLVFMRFVGQRGKSTQTATAATLFSSMLDLMNETHYREFLDEFEGWEKAEAFLLECFGAMRKFLAKSPFSDDWTCMQLAVTRVFLQAAKSLSTSMQAELHQRGRFSVELWSSLFHLYGDVACVPALQLENLSNVQHDEYLEKYGDLRVEAGKEVVALWQQFSAARKLAFIPSFCGVFLKISLLKQRELRKLVIPLFADMLSCELAATGEFQKMVSELVDKLDDLVSVQGMGDNEYKEQLHTIMEECCQKNVALRTAGGMGFVDYSTTLLERLLDLRNVPDGDEHLIPRMQAIVNLMQYYKQMQREAMYIRYIYRLAKLHLAASNYAEAAFTLQRHASMLKWEDTPLSNEQCDFPDLSPAKTELELKINLYRMIIDFFDKAKLYEEAIPLCKELAEQYELVTFQYRKLTPIYQRIADLFGKIVNELRPVHDVFRVGFYGTKAPTFMKGKQFVFRGRAFQHVSDFSHYLLESFPSASILKFNTEPGAEYEYKEGMFIQLAKVEPECPANELRQAAMPGTQLPALNVDTFILNRPIQKGGKDIAHMWIERTVYTTEMTLPSLLHWVPVSRKHTVEISPLANAVESMVAKNKDIRERVVGAESNSEQLNPLSMILNGVIDAAVMGGLAVYEEAFLTKEYEVAHPDEAQLVERLTELIKEQIAILGEGLTVHNKLAPADVRPLHEKMEMHYLEMQQKYCPESIVRTVRAPSFSPSSSSSSLDLLRTNSNGDSAHVVSPNAGRRPTVPVARQSRQPSILSLTSTTSLPAGGSTPTTPKSGRISIGGSSVQLRPFRRIFTGSSPSSDSTSPGTRATRPISFHESMLQGSTHTVALVAMASGPPSPTDSTASSSSAVVTEDDFAPSLFRGARSQSDVSSSSPVHGSPKAGLHRKKFRQSSVDSKDPKDPKDKDKDTAL